MQSLLQTIALTTRRATFPAAARCFSAGVEIPINQVSRVYRMNVGNEETALKVDALAKEAAAKVASQPGFVKMTRTVCKSEWAYEMSIVFDSLDSFKAYDGGDFRANEVMPFFHQAVAMLDEEPYAGVRVHDEFA